MKITTCCLLMTIALANTDRTSAAVSPREATVNHLEHERLERNLRGNYRSLEERGGKGYCSDPNTNNCDPNAQCIQRLKKWYKCVCKEGFTGDGFACDAEQAIVTEKATEESPPQVVPDGDSSGTVFTKTVTTTTTLVKTTTKPDGTKDVEVSTETVTLEEKSDEASDRNLVVEHDLSSRAVTLTVDQVQVAVDKYNELQGSNVQVSQDIVDEINKRTNTYTLYRQLAFVAQTIWESVAYSYTEEIAATTDGMRTRNSYQDCSWAQPGMQRPDNGQVFYGRGYMQLSWCANYKAYGAARARQPGSGITDPDFFYNHPNVVATDYAMDSAAWFFEANVRDNSGRFGETTMAINGFMECNGASPIPVKRFQIFDALATEVGLVGYTDEGCD